MKESYARVIKKQYKAIILFICLIILFLTLCLTSLFFPLQESLTYDEGYHYDSGGAILKGKAAKRGDRNGLLRNIMPLSGLNPLSSRIIKKILPLPQSLKSEPTFLGKSATLFISVILAVYVFLWSYQLYGIPSAFLALILYILDPNIIAHSRVVTQDLLGTCAVFVAVYHFWSFLNFGGRKNLILSTITFGIAQISRFTAVYLIPIYLILAMGFYGSSIIKAIKNKSYQTIRSSIHRAISYVIILSLTTLIIINIGFSFERTFTRFENYQLLSQTFTKLQANPILKSLPVPLPYAYLQGLDFGQYKQETGYGSGMPYVLGRLGFESGHNQPFKIKGFKEYFLIAFLYKVPIATQLLLFIAVISLFVYRKQIRFWQNEAFLLVPSLLYFVFMSLGTAQLGIRYILMIFPLLFVFCSRSVINWNSQNIRYRLFIFCLGIYLLISNLSYFPHYLSYFNELMTNRTLSYKVLVDSNLDWGQNQNYLKQYLENNPQALFLPYSKNNQQDFIIQNRQVKPDRFSIGSSVKLLVIEANRLVGVTADANQFDWLRSSREPIDHIAYSHLVFSISAQDAPHILSKK